MTSSFLEIIQLATGEIILRRAGEEGEPLVTIRFSEESMSHIGESDLDIAKVMIQAGMQATAHIAEEKAAGENLKELSFDDLESSLGQIVH